MGQPLNLTSALLLAALVPSLAAAQAWPAKPIRLVATVGAGTATDVTARLATPRMGEALGQPIVVDNVAALGGTMGAERVAQAAPDGYTLMFTTPSSVVSAFFQRKHVPFKPTDFTPITAAVEPVTLFIVNPSVPASNLREFIELVKKSPGKYNYGTPGVGSVFHLMGEAFLSSTGTKLTHVPYKSLVTAINDTISGETQMTLTAYSNVRSNIAAGKLKALAVLEGQRFSGMPDVPTVAETVPSFEKPASWFALFGPAGLPRPIVQRLYTEMKAAITAPEVKPKLDASGFTIIANTPDEFAAMVKKGFDVYGAVFKAAGLQPED